MKILFVNKFLHPNGGSENYIFKLGGHLRSQGHEVQYFGMEHEGRCVGNRVNAYTKDMDFHGGSRLAKLTYPLRTVYSSEARKKLRLVLCDFQPDVIHLNNFNYQLTPSILLEIGKWRKEGHPCRVVYTAHDMQLLCPNHLCRNPLTGGNCEKCLGGHPLNCVKGKCIHGSTARSAVGAAEAVFWRVKNAYREIDRIICCSGFQKAKLDTDPRFADKTVTLHNFVEIAPYRDTEKKDYVLYFGRYSEEKGVRTLLRVCRELPDIPFVFAGAGPMEKELENVPNIRSAGFQKGEALAALIREARFSVSPSECYENCPFSVMESQCYGTPVLGARIGGIPELIAEGETGELFESGNAEELKRKIQALWNAPERMKRYSENCRGVHFDGLKAYTEKLMMLYKGEC